MESRAKIVNQLASLVPPNGLVLHVDQHRSEAAASTGGSGSWAVYPWRPALDGNDPTPPAKGVEEATPSSISDTLDGLVQRAGNVRLGMLVLECSPDARSLFQGAAEVVAKHRASLAISSASSLMLETAGPSLIDAGYVVVPAAAGAVAVLAPAASTAECDRIRRLVGTERTKVDQGHQETNDFTSAPEVQAAGGPSAGQDAGAPDGSTAGHDESGAEMTSIRALQAEIGELRAHLARVEQRASSQIELQKMEVSRLKADMRSRTDMLQARHEALLNGRIFSTLRTVSKPVRWLVSGWRVAPPSTSTAALEPKHSDTAGHSRATTAALPSLKDPPAAPSAKSATPASEIPGDGSGVPDASLPTPQSVRIAGVSYMSRKAGGVVGAEVTYSEEPLVSVIMTTYNTEAYVEAAVNSILGQTWRNLELVIVDDCSTDATRERIEALQQRDPRVKLYCFGENNGTYYCKNFGITKSEGAVVTFMDSDDVSLPERIEKQFRALNQVGVAVSTCNHVRKDEKGETILINGVAERVAYISQMVKRSVLEEVGYFDTVRTSADDEFLRRIRVTYGPSAQVNVKDVLYVALLREGSLTMDPANAINFVQDRSAPQSFLSPQRRHYAAMCDKWHKHLGELGLRPYVPFPVVRRPFPAFGRLVVGEGRYDGNQITACMATYPPREEKMRIAVEALLPQVDTLNIYLNGYTEIPSYLRHSRIRAVVGESDLRDNGKFYFTGDVPRGFCFTVDDDIAYPPEYVQSLIRKIEFYERKAVVGLHGTVYSKPIRSFFRGRTLLHFEEPLENDVVVNQLGTGTVAFHTDLLRPDLTWFETTGMADVWLALESRRRRIPLIAIARPPHWLMPLGAEETTLFREFRKNDEMQTAVVRRLSPWREELSKELAESVAHKKSRFGDSYARELPMLGVGEHARRA